MRPFSTVKRFFIRRPLLRDALGFARFVGRRLLVEDRCVQVAASLTFTTLLSLVPLLTIVLNVVSAFPVFVDYSARIKLFLLTNLVPDFAGRIITVYMRQFTENAGRLTAVGIVLLAVTALSLMVTIDRTFNGIWRVNKRRPFFQQALVYWTVLTLGPLMLGGGVSGLNWLMGHSALPLIAPALIEPIEGLGAFCLTTLALAMLYGLTPNRHVPLRHALLGAAAAAGLLFVARGGFALYLQLAKSYQLVYGAFASFPILLVWLQLMWLVVLLGAEFTASLSYWQDRAWRRRGVVQRRFRDAIEALLLMNEAQAKGEAPALRDFRHRLHTGYDDIGAVLDTLVAAGLVARVAGDRYVMTCRAEHIRLVRLFELFVLPPLTTRSTSAVAQELKRRLAPAYAALEVSLAELATCTAAPPSSPLPPP